MTDSSSPFMLPPYSLSEEWTVLPSWLPIPGMGGLPVNAFVLDGPEPVLVDTGLSLLGDDFITNLAAVIDPERLLWIWLSHLDFDHIGNLESVLAVAPRAAIVTNFLGVGKMQLAGLDTDRVHMLTPGESLPVGDQEFVPLRPPYYDAPETMGFFATGTGALFVGDCFGALLPTAAEDLGEVSAPDLAEGLTGWSAVDAPWLAGCDRSFLDGSFAALAGLRARLLLTSHLPPSTEDASALLKRICEKARFGEGSADDPLAVANIVDRINGHAHRAA